MVCVQSLTVTRQREEERYVVAYHLWVSEDARDAKVHASAEV